jgi:YggT family protein
MILLANLLAALAFVISSVLSILIFMVIARAILSWVSPDPRNPIVRAITLSTEPFIHPIRSRMPQFAGGLDFSPLVFLMVLYFLKVFLVATLQDYAIALKM